MEVLGTKLRPIIISAPTKRLFGVFLLLFGRYCIRAMVTVAQNRLLGPARAPKKQV